MYHYQTDIMQYSSPPCLDGWKLGEHGFWSKCTNWELDARVPLIMRAPWLPGSIGHRTDAMAELVDMYPTLVELAGLQMDPSETIEGTSLVPVLKDPNAPAPHGKTQAFTQFPRCPQYELEVDPARWQCVEVPRINITRMGYSIRSTTARYTEWRVFTNCEADWTEHGLVAQELYDHTDNNGLGTATFDDFENINLASEPDRQAQIDVLAAALFKQFGGHTGAC